MPNATTYDPEDNRDRTTCMSFGTEFIWQDNGYKVMDIKQPVKTDGLVKKIQSIK